MKQVKLLKSPSLVSSPQGCEVQAVAEAVPGRSRFVLVDCIEAQSTIETTLTVLMNRQNVQHRRHVQSWFKHIFKVRH